MTCDGKTRTGLRRLVDGTDPSHTKTKKHRMRFMVIAGAIILTLVIFGSLCIGPTGYYDPLTALHSLITAIGKGGENLDGIQMNIYYSRFPRTIAALSVGIGLSIAGAAYQSVIRNPLVDPYIMGVSSGAGTAAVSAIAFQVTLFGLLSPHDPYLTAIMAIIGGLLAFGCTMALGELAGGSNNAYVLSGVIVGLIFSAVQTVMILFAGDQLNNALLWLFGSFSAITYAQCWPVFVVAIVMSMIVMKWAKEFNLILLGEDQARQMGLDSHKFSMLMLLLASILTSVCVAFCGIIGFVGLVIPHLCRMIFGGDNRLVMPASITFGGSILIAADIISRIALPGYELPVGAITTLVGVPVFAYLLFKRGRIYNG